MPDHNYWAKEAERLLSDDTLNRALNDARQECMELLAVAHVGDVTELLRLQALIAATQGIREKLYAMVSRRSEAPPENSPFA